MRWIAVAASTAWALWLRSAVLSRLLGLVLGGAALLACQGGSATSDAAVSCAPACAANEVCRTGACVPVPAACSTSTNCRSDERCAEGACLAWESGASDLQCHGAPAPGVFFPGVQCAWRGPPADDAFPSHVNVLSTPMVAALRPGSLPSIVFTAYNFTDHGIESCGGNAPAAFGVIRVIDGATCAQHATLAVPSVVGAAAPAVADLDGDGALEIVAARSGGGLVAFTQGAIGWQVLWQTQPPFPAAPCDWAGPSIHDLDDDGAPEVIFYGAVYSGRTGATIDASLANTVDATGVGYIPVVADVDRNGIPDLVTGGRLYAWDKARQRWATDRPLQSGSNGHVAVADFGTFPAVGADDRSRTDGIAETVVVFQGDVRVFTVDGREVFSAKLQRSGLGGPPVLADFDGDGRLEIGTAGATAYTVLDPDCHALPDPATCAAMTTDGVLWQTPTQGTGAEVPGSSAFDFDGDGRAEVVHADRCFARIYDGRSGAVLYSRARTSCTWLDAPVVADVDGDHNAELVTFSNPNCGAACPALDPQFDGVACVDDADCPSASATPMTCGRDQLGDALGRCRCADDRDCGDGFACSDPRAGASPVGKVCRAAHPRVARTGVEVLADALDRWGDAPRIWNQHAFAITNVDVDGRVPRTSAWRPNWTQPGLNSFRQTMLREPAASRLQPDLTIRTAGASCDADVPTITAEVCNRGSAAVDAGVPVAVYAATTPSKLRCQTETAAVLAPGACAVVQCVWNGPAGDGAVAIDDRGTGRGIARECREDNNVLAIRVSCAGPP